MRLAAESRYLRSVRFLAQRASEYECVFRFPLLPSFSFFLDVVASATCPTISRSSDGGSRRRRLAVDPELPTALTKTPFSLHALSISTTLVQTDRYVPSTPCVNSHRLPLQAGKKSEPFHLWRDRGDSKLSLKKTTLRYISAEGNRRLLLVTSCYTLKKRYPVLLKKL